MAKKARTAKQKAATKKMLAANKAKWGNSGPKGHSGAGGKKAKQSKGRRKPSAAQVAKMRAGARRYWAAKRGKPKRPMPLSVLKDHRKRLDYLIAKGGK